MASPTVRGTPVEGAGASATTHTITFSQTTGDRVVIFFAVDATARTLTLGDSFVNLTNTSATFHIFTKVLNGSEGGDMVVTAAVATKSAWIAYNITTGTHDSATAPVFSTVATGTSTAPNAGSLTPAGGSKDYLWLTAFGQAGEEADDDTWVSGTPTSFSNLLQKATGTSGAVTVNCQTASARYAYTNSVLDAAAFTTAQSLAWRAYTVAIYPDTTVQKTGTAETGTATDTQTGIVVGRSATAETGTGSDTASLAAAFLGAYFDEVMSEPGLAGYWRLGEASGNPQDSHGTNHATTVVGAPTYGVTGALAGDSDKAMTLNGTSSYISVADHASLDLGDTWTMEAWINRGATGANRAIVSKGTGGYYLRVLAGGNLNILKSQTTDMCTSNAIIPTGWHHVAATKSGSSVHLYCDGAEMANGGYNPATTTDNTYPLTIGAEYNGSTYGEFDNASLDEVAVYNTELTPERIRAHYLSGTYGAAARTESGTGTDTGSASTPPVDKTGTLETGTATDAASLAAARSGTAESGTGTDAATLATAATGALETGTGSDAATQNYPRSSTAESGAGTDASSLAAARSSTAESGTGSDAAATPDRILATVTDSGTGTDAASLAAAIAGSESGTGTDAATVESGSTPKAGEPESGAGTDAATLAAARSGTAESGAATDASTLAAAISGAAESGAGTDASSAPTVARSAAESGTGTDAAALAPAIAASDSSVGSDAATQNYPRSSTAESGAGTDAATLASAIAGAAETAAGTDAATLAAAIAASESATGSDVSSVNYGTTDKSGEAETGTGDDGAGSVYALFLLSKSGAYETFTGTDDGFVTQDKTGTLETGTGTDAQTRAAAITPTETGTGTDATTAPKGVVTGSDAGAATDTVAYAGVYVAPLPWYVTGYVVTQGTRVGAALPVGTFSGAVTATAPLTGTVTWYGTTSGAVWNTNTTGGVTVIGTDAGTVTRV